MEVLKLAIICRGSNSVSMWMHICYPWRWEMVLILRPVIATAGLSSFEKVSWAL